MTEPLYIGSLRRSLGGVWIDAERQRGRQRQITYLLKNGYAKLSGYRIFATQKGRRRLKLYEAKRKLKQ